MKKLFLSLAFISLALHAQSDCGNCWVINGGCDPLAICDVNGVCQVCAYFLDCDDHNCASGPHFICSCPWGASAPTAACLNNQMKHTILKQKLLNQIAMRNLEMRNTVRRHNLLLAVHASYLR